MQHEDINITIHVANADVVLEVGGEIDLLSAETLAAALQQIDADRDVVVDCGAVSFMDCSGLNVLVDQWHRASRAGGSLHVVHPSYPVLRVIETTGLTTLLEAGDDPSH